MAKKINHVIQRVRGLVADDEFLDAGETVRFEGELVRMDEALIILAELRSVLARQWASRSFERYRKEHVSWISQVVQ